MKSIVLRIILLILIITIFPLVGSCQYGHSKHELTGPVEYKWFERFGIRGKSANAVSDIRGIYILQDRVALKVIIF